MLVSKTVLETLIVDLALRGEFERENAHELLYHLSIPGPAIPACVAEVIIEHPEVTDTPSQLPARIAFGLVDDAFCRFDLEVRKQRQLKLFRALNLVRLELQEQEFPDLAIARSCEYHGLLLFSAEALQRLATEECVFPAEASALVEQLLFAHLELQAVTELLIEIQIRRLTRGIRARLLERFQSSLSEGLSKPASDHCAVMVPTEAMGFRESLRTHSGFEATQERLNSLFSHLC